MTSLSMIESYEPQVEIATFYNLCAYEPRWMTDIHLVYLIYWLIWKSFWGKEKFRAFLQKEIIKIIKVNEELWLIIYKC
jgi:hypothetical protein